MAAFELRRNARVEIHDQPYLLIKRIEGGGDNANIWQLEHERTGRLQEYSQRDMLEMLRTGLLRHAPPPQAAVQQAAAAAALHGRAATTRVWETVSEAARNIARERLVYVKAALDRPLSNWGLRKAIGDTPKPPGSAAPPSPSALRRWVRAYVGGGRDIAALLPQTKNRGNRKPRFTPELAAILDDSIDNIYLTPERPTLQDTLDDAIVRVERANRMLPRGEQRLPMPTRRMLRSVLDRRDPFDICVARYGQEYAAHKFRLLLKGCRVAEGMRRAEIDHTLVNCNVIDDRTFMPLGRPWLTLCIEVRHRVILGYALSFEPPSYLSVMRCLKHAIMPKTYLQERHPSLKYDWPCHGLFETLGLDNGKDFESAALRDFADRYGIDLDYCPVRRPWIKGTVERALGSANRGLTHGQRGTTFEDLIQRGDYDSASRACITLHDLHEQIHIWIVDYYHERVHRSLQMSPRQSWCAEMRDHQISLPTSAVELDQALSIPDRRTLTHKGIELDHMFYNTRECGGILAAAGGSIEVDIFKPADDVGYIYLLDPRNDTHLRVPVIERYSEYASGLTPWQHRQCVRYASTHHAGRHDAVALAEAKCRIRDGFIKALARLRNGARKSAARFLSAPPDAPIAVRVDDAGPAPAATSKVQVVARAITASFSLRRAV